VRPLLLFPLLLLPLLLACTAPASRPDRVDDPARSAAVGFSGETGSPDSDPPHTGDSAPPDDTGPGGDTAVPAGPPLVVVILADDLGDNYLWAMDGVIARLLPESVRFTRAYTTVPLCCPVRASFLQGGWYPAQTGVLGNDAPNGGVALFSDTDTLATRLQAAGFATALLGKYLNNYEDGWAPYVPPGWDLFLVPTTLGDFTDAEVLRGSSAPDAAGAGELENTGGAYLTDWLFDEALAFVDAHPDTPAFVFLTVQTPHVYATPAAEDVGSAADFSPRPASWNEADVSDKPAWLQSRDLGLNDIDNADANARLMMENLASLDRAVVRLVDGLDARGLTDRTTLVFTGDNGYLHGEHRLTAKSVPYEEVVRVPLIVRAPGVAPREDARLVAMNLDLPATIADIAGLPPVGEGVSLRDALAEPTLPLRDHIFIDGTVGQHPVWAGIVTARWKYVEWGSGERELYDLVADPAELDSVHGAPPDSADLAAFAAWTEAHRSLNITTREVPTGTVGVPYTATLETWGGDPPFAWVVDLGMLPPGLTLDDAGVVSGVPTTAGSYTVQLRVRDAGVSPVTGGPQTFAAPFRLVIGAAARATASHDGRGATFRIPARPGQRVSVSLSRDETRDMPPLHTVEGVAGIDGVARLALPDVDHARAWFWSYAVDGIVLPGGALAR